MDRIEFFGSLSGMQYPEMVVNFFDHIIALKQLVEDSGSVNVLNSTDNSISFSITFKNSECKDKAYAMISSLGGVIVIYGRQIIIRIDNITNQSLEISLI